MAEMTFWDHLEELRWVLFRVIGLWLCFSGRLFYRYALYIR